jgi:hypothetical protein
MLAAKPPALTAYLRIMAHSTRERKMERKTRSMHASSQTSSCDSLTENNGVLYQGEEEQ